VIFDGRQLFEYDVSKNQWARLPDPPQVFAQSQDMNGRWVAAPIASLGVIMYLMYSPEPAVYLYKHGGGVGVVDSVPPNPPANLSSD